MHHNNILTDYIQKVSVTLLGSMEWINELHCPALVGYVMRDVSREKLLPAGCSTWRNVNRKLLTVDIRFELRLLRYEFWHNFISGRKRARYFVRWQCGEYIPRISHPCHMFPLRCLLLSHLWIGLGVFVSVIRDLCWIMCICTQMWRLQIELQ
jgi:hypothetical protein